MDKHALQMLKTVGIFHQLGFRPNNCTVLLSYHISTVMMVTCWLHGAYMYGFFKETYETCIHIYTYTYIQICILPHLLYVSLFSTNQYIDTKLSRQHFWRVTTGLPIPQQLCKNFGVQAMHFLGGSISFTHAQTKLSWLYEGIGLTWCCYMFAAIRRLPALDN